MKITDCVLDMPVWFHSQGAYHPGKIVEILKTRVTVEYTNSVRTHQQTVRPDQMILTELDRVIHRTDSVRPPSTKSTRQMRRGPGRGPGNPILLMRTTDAIAYLCMRFERYWHGSLHNLLWQIGVNQPSRDCAFTIVYNTAGAEIAIADRGKAGYTPTNVYAKDELPKADLDKMVEAINARLLGRTEMDALDIVASSMKEQNRKTQAELEDMNEDLREDFRQGRMTGGALAGGRR